MKTLAIALSLFLLPIALVQAGGAPSSPPHHLAPAYDCPDCKFPRKVRKTHTEELSRKGFQKWEEHCCGIRILANYIRVVYRTHYCNGDSRIWHMEYRAGS